MVKALTAQGMAGDEIERLFHTFNAWSEPFRAVPVPVDPPRRRLS
jgi:hypothetical protein